MDALALALAFAVTSTSALLVSRVRNNKFLVKDVFKPYEAYVPKVGGLAVIVSSMTILVALSALGPLTTHLMALVATIAFVGLVGLVDDLWGLHPMVRVLATLLPSIAIVLLGLVKSIYIPPIGNVREPYVVTFAALLSIPVMANAVNMLDVVNGVVPSSVAMISLTLALVSYLIGKHDAIYPALLLALMSLGLYLFNRYPAKVLNGNSGSYALGAGLGALALLYDLGLPALIASLPYILNGMFIVFSSRGIKGRDRLVRPTLIINGQVHPSISKGAPLTLVRFIVLDRPGDERFIISSINRLFIISCTLALVSTLLLRWFP